VTVTGMVVGSLSVVIYTIIGRNPDEVANLTKKVESLETANNHLVKQKDELENMVITLQENMIDKVSILGASFIDNLIERKKAK
jgi:5'-deoxynucleotidase YfbR-like HD superfamily hydrolase